MSEVMGWYPTFLAPLLTGALIANRPTALPPKAGVALVIVQGCGAYTAFVLASLLIESPFVLFGAIGLILFLSFASLAQGRGFLPILLILISFATVPIVTMAAPQQAGVLPLALVRSMAIAAVMVWVVHVLWPQIAKAARPAPAPAFATPLAMAVAGTVIVLPLMLVYLMYGITDALPILITTVLLVITFDPQRGAMQGAAMVLGNFIGGMAAILASMLLQAAPNLATLGLVAFLIGIGFASRIERGGPAGAVGLVTYNQTMVMFSLAIVPDGGSSGLWGTRLLQFGIACLFAVGMMTLLLPRQATAGPPSDEG